MKTVSNLLEMKRNTYELVAIFITVRVMTAFLAKKVNMLIVLENTTSIIFGVSVAWIVHMPIVL